MAGAEREDNSDLTLKSLSARFDACEWRVEYQFQTLHQTIENLGLNSNKNCDCGRNNRADGLNLSRPTHQRDDLKHHNFYAQCSVNKKVGKFIIDNGS